MRLLLLATTLAFFLTACQSADETAAVQAVVTDYHKAVATGDEKAAMKDFAEDAMMLESGIVETRQQYQDNHLPGDIEFEAQVKNTLKTLKLEVSGNSAYVISSMDLAGDYDGSPMHLEGLELMVLSKVDGAWKIRSIAWNSHRA